MKNLDGLKSWQDQCFTMNQQARDDLALWLQCIRPNGGSSMLIDAIRRAYLYQPKQIVILTDAVLDMKPSNIFSVSVPAFSISFDIFALIIDNN